MMQKFSGFRGHVAFAQIGDIQFGIIANNPKQLRLLWESILQEAGPFDPAMINRVILIEATILPPKKTKSQSAPTVIDV